MMKKLLVLAAGVALMTLAAMAAGTHSGGHGHSDEKADDHHGDMAVGKPGKKSEAKRSIIVVMKESDDGDMLFEPKSIKVKKGETIRFRIQNVGEEEHEFVLDNHEGVMEHKALMEKFPEMEHDDPNSVRLEAGKKGEVVWKFTNTGEFEFACLIPGHYDLGMKGTLTVASK